jgi:hypothetical protein
MQCRSVAKLKSVIFLWAKGKSFAVIGRRFKNDTERLEKLLDLYTKMTAKTKTV